LRRPVFWVVLALLSAAATAVGVHYFPQAFSIVALDITMDRGRALDEARAIATRDGLGPAGFRQAASFAGDNEAQTFVELEGGGKDALTRMLRDNLYASYSWKVRHFKDGETNESTIEFTPDGRPYGFVEKLKEDAPGTPLDAGAARRIAETGAASRWHVDLSKFTLVEQGQERRPSKRIDHTFTYERTDATLNEGRYRLRLTVAGDRLTGVEHFIKIPEAFTRRYASMRSANELIGIGSAVGLALLYVVGGIGVGLFYMMRRRWVLWRQAAMWGVVVGGLQTLAALNEFPLAWMNYDTAIPVSTFIAQQAAFLVAGFIGFSVFFALSFTAAETLTRRAFPNHPQFWRVWSGPGRPKGLRYDEEGRDSPDGPGREHEDAPGASVEILGRTVAGYLLVSIFFAYDVVLYLVMTKAFGWWSPAEALVHPDVLATYAPWLSAIANSFQAGFWEEALFRAVPIAGAALIGDRFGKRNLFIGIAFVVQAIIFGAGHAPYPNQPSYARPVELIIPSIGFGLLYLYFGLLPGVILHFAFDVVWFALPIFMAKAPGIWVQQAMVILFTFVPVWVVLWRRLQAGRWITLSPDALNAAWTPPPAPPAPIQAPAPPQQALPRRLRTAWLAIGGLALAGCVVAVVARAPDDPFGSLPITRTQAETLTRQELQKRGVELPAKWRVMAVPDDGSGAPHQFVYETAGETRWRELLGVYLPKPRWRVRVAMFEGDVADRAEEWRAYVTAAGEVRGVVHTPPEARAGASLDEAAARARALAAIKERFGLDAAQLKEISAKPTKQKARMDWALTYADSTIAALPQGEPRINVGLAGDEVVSVGRYVHVPEEWERGQRAASTRNLVLQILVSVMFGGLLAGGAVAGMIGWSRGTYAPRLFLLAAALVLVLSLVDLANGWPSLLANVSTAVPLQVQLIGILAIAGIGFILLSAMVGLTTGALPPRLAPLNRVAEGDAIPLGLAAGLFAGAMTTAAAFARTPAWARFPSVDALGAASPMLEVALGPLTGMVMSTAILLTALLAIDRITTSWTRRRGAGLLAIVAFGVLAGGVPSGSSVAGWLLAGAIMAAGVAALYITLLRFDPTLVPLMLGAMAAVRAIATGAQRPFPGALSGAAIAAVMVLILSWWWFRVLRRPFRVKEPAA
jgi:hypothetical protein